MKRSSSVGFTGWDGVMDEILKAGIAGQVLTEASRW
jgi:hypothetical protein